MEKTSIETSDASAETLLSSIDDLSDDGYPMIVQQERDQWRQKSRQKTKLIMALTFAIITISITAIIQAHWLRTRDASDSSVVPAGSISGQVKDSEHLALDGINDSYTYDSVNPCGSTPSEAAELGCVFDYMQFSWQPPECYFPHLDQKHIDLMQAAFNGAGQGPLRYWADANLTQPIVDDPKTVGQHPVVWVDRRYHYVHCFYSWEVMHHAYDNSLPIPAILDRKHTTHCSNVLWRGILEWDDSKLLIERNRLWFGGCAYPANRVKSRPSHSMA